jgi:hypothetical protein
VKVLILHTLPPEQSEPDRWREEFDLKESAEGIASVLPGAVVCGLRGEVAEITEAINSYSPDVVFNLCGRETEKSKRAAHLISIQTQNPSLPIISSLEALLARRLFHPRTPIRSVVSLLDARLLESGATALVFARFYNVTSRRQAAFGRKHPLCFPKMSLRLFCGVVNPTRLEIRILESNRSGGAFWNLHPLFSPDDLFEVMQGSQIAKRKRCVSEGTSRELERPKIVQATVFSRLLHIREMT